MNNILIFFFFIADVPPLPQEKKNPKNNGGEWVVFAILDTDQRPIKASQNNSFPSS